MKRFLAILLAVVFMQGVGLAEQGEIIGGSGSDMIAGLASHYGVTVVVGATASSDGTLYDRTKTGRSGWVCAIDAESRHIMWNFCTRYGSMDYMESPYIHEDGSISAVLIYDSSKKQQGAELVSLDANGKQGKRVTLTQHRPDRTFSVDAGVLVTESAAKEKITVATSLFDYEGVKLWTKEDTVPDCAAGAWALEGRGNIVTLWQVTAAGLAEISCVDVTKRLPSANASVCVQHMACLQDGSVAAVCVTSAQGAQANGAFLLLWDAQGTLRMEENCSGDVAYVLGKNDRGVLTLDAGGIVWLNPYAGGEAVPYTTVGMENALYVAVNEQGMVVLAKQDTLNYDRNKEDVELLWLADSDLQQSDVSVPVADGNTMYYNPDGGSCYHADRNCPSVSQRYLPLQGSFDWAERNNAPYSVLAPCGICHAPQR